MPYSKEKKREYDKKYRELNKEKKRECNRKYNEKNKEKRAECDRRYRELNKEKKRECNRKYRELNKEKIADYRRKHREENKEKMREERREHHKEKRAHCIEYLGGKCVVCGTTHNLQFDHIKRETKKYTIGRRIHQPFTIIKEELDKCQLLCYDCHKIKTKSERTIINALLK